MFRWLNPINKPVENAVTTLLFGIGGFAFMAYSMYRLGLESTSYKEVSEILRIISQDPIIAQRIHSYTILCPANMDVISSLVKKWDISRDDATNVVKYCILNNQGYIDTFKIFLGETTPGYIAAYNEFIANNPK